MSRRLPPLNALKAFEAAARHLSFTKAAKELYVTQAAVSQQIKTLEADLGLQLFVRKNRALFLTEAGQGYFLDIRNIFKQLTAATDKLVAKSAQGTLTVSLMPSFAIGWLIPRLKLFNEQYPDIDVRIKAQDLEEDSLTEDVDVAIYYGKGHWQDLEVHKLHTEYLVPLCSPLLLNGTKPLNTIDDLQHHVLLHDTTRNHWKAWLNNAPEVGDKDKIKSDQGPIFSHSAMVLQAAGHGQGIALGNSVLAKPDIEAGRLVIPFSHSLESKNAFYLVFRQSQATLGKILSFKNWMLDLVEQEQTS